MFLPAPGPGTGGVLLTFRGWIWEAGNSREIRDFLADCSARPWIEGNAFSSIQREGNSGGILFVPPERATQGQRVMENGEGKGNPDIPWNLQLFPLESLPSIGCQSQFSFWLRRISGSVFSIPSALRFRRFHFPAVKSLDPNLEMGME